MFSIKDKAKIETGFVGSHYRKNHGLIRSFRYSWKYNVLEIGFNNGKIIWYYNFPERQESDFYFSQNPDSYFQKNISDKFHNEEYTEELSEELLLQGTLCLNRLIVYYQVGAFEKMIKLCDRIIQKKKNEGYQENLIFSMEVMEKAKALCKLDRFAEVLALLEKNTGIYANHLKLYSLIKIGRLDQAIKLLIKLTKQTKYGLYIGRIEFSEVHQLFVEMSIMSSLKRSLTNNEKEIIEKIIQYSKLEIPSKIRKVASLTNNEKEIIEKIITNKHISNGNHEFVNLVTEMAKKLTLHFDTDELEKIYQTLTKTEIQTSRFLAFDEARNFIQKLNLENETAWKKYCISGQKPTNIPINPKKEYKFEWKSWNDWLGITKRKYLSFEDAKKFVANLNLESEKEWNLYHKSGKLPENIPSNPKNVYTSKWKDYNDWLGVYDREYLPFEQAKEYVSKFNFEYQNQWKEYCLSGQKPKNIPAKPDIIYQKQWTGWDDWFGVFEREYLSYAEQKKFVSRLNFNSTSEWTEYAKSGQKPKNIPAKPFKYFLKKGIFFDLYDWIGLNEREYLPFIEARNYVRSLKLKNYEQYGAWNNSDQRPSNIPQHPSYIYREKGWFGYADWIGISR